MKKSLLSLPLRIKSNHSGMFNCLCYHKYIITNENIIRPTESKILPLGCRDVIRPGRQIYELILVYNFNVAKATEVIPDW